MGADVHRGDLDDLDGLAKAAGDSDGVVHLAFKHDAMRAGDFGSAVVADLHAINAIGDALVDSGKPLVTASGTLTLSAGGLGGVTTEADVLAGGPRIDAENAVIGLAERGIRSSVVRLPPIVHGQFDRHGFTPTLIAIARDTGVAGYVGGLQPLARRARARRGSLVRAGAGRGPSGVPPARRRRRGGPVPEDRRDYWPPPDGAGGQRPAAGSGSHFGFLGHFVSLDNPTSSGRTRSLVTWTPTRPGLIDDLDEGHYFTDSTAAR
jgi:hypothetical protein